MNFEDLKPLAGEWNALVSRSGASVFQTYEWNFSWWKVFGEGSELCVLLAYEGSRLVGVAPLELSPGRVLRFVGGSNHSSDYCDFVTDPEVPGVLEAFLTWISERHVPWDEFDWFNAPGTSRHLAAAKGVRAAGKTFSRITDAPARVLGDAEADREVLAKKSLKRHFNSFQKNGKLEFKVCDSVSEIEGFLEAFFQQHIERRAVTRDPSLFLDPRQKQFYREVLSSLFPLGILHFAVVKFDDEPIAFHFGFIHDGKFVWYKPTFAMKYLKQSPGEVLLKFLLEDAMARKLKEFDFTVGEEGFKYRFATEIRGNFRLRAFQSPLRYRAAQARDVARRLRSRLRALRGQGPRKQPAET